MRKSRGAGTSAARYGFGPRLVGMLAAQGVRPAMRTRTRFQSLPFVIGQRHGDSPRLAAARTPYPEASHGTPSFWELGEDAEDCRRVVLSFATINFNCLLLSAASGDDLNGWQWQTDEIPFHVRALEHQHRRRPVRAGRAKRGRICSQNPRVQEARVRRCAIP